MTTKKYLLLLPLLIAPLAAVLYWYLQKHPMSQKVSGINTSLPEVPSAKHTPEDKMSFYHVAEEDTAKWREATKNDPYYQSYPSDTISKGSITAQNPKFTASEKVITSPEKKVYDKLAQLQEVLQKPSPATPSIQDSSSPVSITDPSLDRMEAMLQEFNTPAPADPEINQLNDMLHTILDIQHPERMAAQLQKKSQMHPDKVFPVTPIEKQLKITLLSEATPTTVHGFYGLSTPPVLDTLTNATITAVIEHTQTVVNGSVVQLRLTQDIYLQGQKIPTGQFLWGTAHLNGERLEITISGIAYQNRRYPVALTVYSTDGNKGLHIPGTITRKSIKQSTAQNLQSLGVDNFNTSLGAQVATAGIQATQQILSKKVSLIKVTIKAGDPVLLQDEHQKL
ncbi:conjugative transposon protein TraM [Zhouia sp. PK063]|uniref:conjugative transposon protein TraM n=1 Tax=Zhouia sp. PK063 TaxID=3373602 RepID=UPI0037A4C69E